jgi:hypothetical protein
VLNDGAELVMQAGFIALGSLAAAAWLAAAAASALTHLRGQTRPGRLGGGLAGLGVALALCSGVWWWLHVGWLAGMADAAGPAAGLALLTVVVRMVLAIRRPASTDGLPVAALAAGLQALAVWEMSGGLAADRQSVFLPGWMALRTLTALVGYAAIAVSVASCGAQLLPPRWLGLPEVEGGLPDAVPAESPVEGRAQRLALAGVSLAVCLDLTRSWWGRGELARDGLAWMLISWLLLVAAVGGLWLGAIERRPARLLLLCALAAALGATLTLTN